MLRSNIKCVKIPISPCINRFFSEELRSRASSTKQHSAEVFKLSAKTVSAAFHTKQQRACNRYPTPIPSLPTRKQKPLHDKSNSVSVVLRSRTCFTLRAPSSPSLQPVAHASVTSKGLQHKCSPPLTHAPQQHKMRQNRNLTTYPDIIH
jgi:hypothetical protein